MKVPSQLSLSAFGFGFALLGLILLGLYFPRYSEALGSRAWPSTSAHVSKGEVTATGGRTTFFSPSVTFSYRVNGQDYLGTDHLRPRPSHDAAQGLLDEYPQGKLITVFYDPRHPQSAVLERGESAQGSYLVIELGAWLFVVGIIFLGLVVGKLVSTRAGKLHRQRFVGTKMGKTP